MSGVSNSGLGARGQLLGTLTNDDAAAGNVGEFISATVLAAAHVALTNNTPADVTSISLTAGDWDVFGNVVFDPAGTTTMTSLIAWTSAVSASFPTRPNAGGEIELTLSFLTGNPQTFPVPSRRLSLASTTTVYLSVYCSFGISTLHAYGFLGARRRR